MGVTVGCRQSNLVNTPSQRLSSLWSSSYIIAGHKKSVQLVHNTPSFNVRCSVSSGQVESRVAAVEQQSVKPECFGVFFLTYDLKTEEERQSLKKLITDAVSGAAGMISNHHLIQEKHTYLKFLVSNAFAGSVIGKGGSIITNFQKESGARIMLSGNQEFFPGTADRIIMLSGKIGDVLKAMDLILNRLLSEIQSEDGDDAEQRSKVRLVVPSSCCGAIIGKGGVTIKSFIEESGASISISPQEHNFIGLSDQIVTLAGSFEEQMQVIDLILSKLTEEQLYLQSMNAPLSYPIVPAAYNNYGPPNGGGGKYMNNNKEDRVSSLTIGLAAEHIGVVIGRGGRNISEICETSGASIKISERGDFMAGTSKRKVTITGSLKSIKAAEAMIKEKVDSVAEINEPLRGAIAR